MASSVNTIGVGSVIQGVGTQSAECDCGVWFRNCTGSAGLVVVTNVICVNIKYDKDTT